MKDQKEVKFSKPTKLLMGVVFSAIIVVWVIGIIRMLIPKTEFVSSSTHYVYFNIEHLPDEERKIYSILGIVKLNEETLEGEVYDVFNLTGEKILYPEDMIARGMHIPFQGRILTEEELIHELGKVEPIKVMKLEEADFKEPYEADHVLVPIKFVKE